VAWMLQQNDEPEYGARPLRRIIRRNVREPLADFLLRANPPGGTAVRIDANDNGLTFAALVDGEEISVHN
jgi:ATP-dependent Clp protease ATP-binding subunit ClpA